MTRLKLVSTKISDEWVDRLEEATRLTGLTQSALVRKAIGQYLGLETVDHVDRVDPYRSELDDIKARLTTLEKSTGLTMVDPTPPQPIAVVTLTSPPPPIATAVVVNTSPPIATAVVVNTSPPIATTITSPPIANANAEPTPTPIDSTDVIWYSTSQAHQLLQARGYKKTIQSFRRDLRPSIEKRQLSSEFLSFGLVADFEARLSFESKVNKALWLRLDPIG